MGRTWSGEDSGKIRRRLGKKTLHEDNLGKVKLSSGRESTKMKFMASSRGRGVLTSMKNTLARV